MTLLVGLALHLGAPLVIIPALALALHRTPDTDGGSGMITAMILIAAMPVAAGATVWTARGGGDQPAMVGLVFLSTLLSPLTLPFTLAALSPLLSRDYAATLAAAARIAGHGFALTGVVLPCAAGLVCHIVMPRRALAAVARTAPSTAFAGSLLLTYLNASGALGRSWPIRTWCCPPHPWPSPPRCAHCRSSWAARAAACWACERRPVPA
ncbi:hypothetical protein ACFSNO_05700 [Streptomyces cirratus]